MREQGEERVSEDAELKPSEAKKQKIERRGQKRRAMETMDHSQSQGEEVQQSEDDGKRRLD